MVTADHLHSNVRLVRDVAGVPAGSVAALSEYFGNDAMIEFVNQPGLPNVLVVPSEVLEPYGPPLAA